MSDDTNRAVSLFAVVRAESSEQLAQMVATCAEQDWTGRLDLVIAAPIEDRPVVADVLTEWTRGVGTFVINPSGRRSAGLNLAADACDTSIVVRVDARARLAPDHVRRCVARLEADSTVGVVGGAQVPEADPADGTVADGIGLALANPMLLGGAAYRRPGAHGSVDTVYLGAFRRSELLALRYDEALEANEDFDLCDRYRADGLQVWLEAGLAVGYRPRGTLSGLARQYEAFGRSKVHMWRRSGHGPNGRQLVALGAAGVGLAAAATQLRRPRRLLAGAALLATAYAASDAVTVSRPATPQIRAVAVAAHAVSHASWLWGVGSGLVDRTPPR